MAAVVVAIVSLTVLGVVLVLCVERGAAPLRVLSTSFLYGSGAIYFVLLGLSVVHVRWSIVSVTAGALVVFVAASVFARVGGGRDVRPSFSVADLVTGLTVVGYALYATIAPVWEWDFWAIWGLKARQFFEVGGIDWAFLERPWNAFLHPDYPLLLPLNFDFVALLAGGWSDRWLGALFVAWAIATLLVVRDLASHETTPLVAGLITLAATTFAASGYIGLAEGPMIAFGGAGVLFIRRALLFDEAAAWRHGAILLGLAACTKNEGIALIASVVVALALSDFRRARRALRLWPALAIALPWIILKAFHSLQNDIAAGSIVARAASRLPHTMDILAFLSARLADRWFWVAILAGVLVAPAAARKRERFVLLVTAIQLAVYAAAYFVTPHDPRWHIATSWPRLTRQIALPVAVSVMLMLANSLRGAIDSTHAEARSEE